jgi:D-alanine-D-alanine ligase
MTKKLLILCGGRTGEHEVSLQSAKNIIEAVDKDKYEVVVVGINKEGKWILFNNKDFLENPDDPKKIKLKNTGKGVVLADRKLINLENGEVEAEVDVVFPVLHGTFGEDGTMQGLLKINNLPFVGSSVLGSSIAMDKEIAKRLLRDSNIEITKFLILEKYEKNKINFNKAKEKLGLPIFIKPANGGSSIGNSIVENKEEFNLGIEEAFKYDNKILLEEKMFGRELECSVLGNENPIAGAVGEILPQKDFYSYEAKYIDSEGAKLEAPAKLEEEIIKRIQDLAIKTFKTLACEGMARVDFFLTKDKKLVVNEVNTIPGFTKISMYPKLFELSGIKYTELISKLIELAEERFKRESKLNF